MQQNNLPINCNIRVYDLLKPLVQCLKCAQIVQNSSKLKKKKKTGQSRLSQAFLFFFEKGRRIGQCTSDGSQHPLSSPLFLKPGLHARRKHKHKHKHKHKKPTCKPVRRKHKLLVLALVLMLASSRFTPTTQRRKHKHKLKRMERFPFSCACAYACVVTSYV